MFFSNLLCSFTLLWMFRNIEFFYFVYKTVVCFPFMRFYMDFTRIRLPILQVFYIIVQECEKLCKYEVFE